VPNNSTITDPSTLDQSQALREQRWTRRHLLGRFGADLARAAGSITDRHTGEIRPDYSAVPFRRVCGCGFARGNDVVKLGYSDEGRYAYVAGGVNTCSSVWLCPVCAAKIRRRRTTDV
jgi:hypothetical protein